MEDRVATAGGRDIAIYRGLPLPAGNQQVEQGGTQAVLVHILKLARRATSGLRDDHSLNFGHDHSQRVNRLMPSGPLQVSYGAKSDGRGDGGDPHYPTGFSW